MAVKGINNQIDSLQDSIYAMNRILNQKRDDLERLQRIHANMVTCQDEFSQHESDCTDPELSARTWHGKLASHFESFRENELLGSYQSLSRSNLGQMINRVSSEIQAIKQSIGDVSGTISTQQTRLSHLAAERKSELNG